MIPAADVVARACTSVASPYGRRRSGNVIEFAERPSKGVHVEQFFRPLGV